MKRSLLALLFVVAAVRPASMAVSVPITIQEALYSGGSAGITRTNYPVTFSLPLPDDAATGASSTGVLGLTGASVGQFRVLASWPSGRIKWVQIDTQASLTGGLTNTSYTLTNSGSGNFGGSVLATDNGSTITIATGNATFVVKKANFNVIDSATVGIGATTVLATQGSSAGLFITGPTAGNTTCGTCTTVYSSANDATSTAAIEENGPAKAVIRATGAHKDGSGNVYLRYTVRLFFYKNQSFVKLESTLRNADYGTSSTFATATKGLQAYEYRLVPTLTGTANFTIGNATGTPTTGTLTGSDTASIYQGESQLMKWDDWCGSGCVPYTTDTGFVVAKNGSTLTSGTDTQYPAGYADIRGATDGAGVELGVYQFSAYWPKSLEFNTAGSDTRIGIWPRQNSSPVYVPWPQWQTHDLWLNFHDAAVASPVNEFLKFQHFLMGRATGGAAYYNSTGVFPYALMDPTAEDAAYTDVANTAVPTLSPSTMCCPVDYGITSIFWPLYIYRNYAWHAGGGFNQTEFRWSWMLNFLTRGFTGRYLRAFHFYRFQGDSAFPHADGFTWSSHPGEYDANGFPTATSANRSLGIDPTSTWRDEEHGHWYGMTDYYNLTGDELAKETLLGPVKDWFLNNTATDQGGTYGANPLGLFNSRSIGVELMGAARMSTWLSGISDADAAGVLDQGRNIYDLQVNLDMCVSGWPVGCSYGSSYPWLSQGVSHVRGVPYGKDGTAGTWPGDVHDVPPCGNSTYTYRVAGTFQAAILAQGLLEFRTVKGSTWLHYWDSLDQAYGMTRWALSEMYKETGDGTYTNNGFRYYITLDELNGCNSDYLQSAQQTISPLFLAAHLEEGGTSRWVTNFKTNLRKDTIVEGAATSDFGSYGPAAVFAVLANPGTSALVDVPITSVTDNGGGSYTLHWTSPGAALYRVKWAAKPITDWLGFDPVTNTFNGNLPTANVTWWAANNAPGIPTPGNAGAAETLTITTLTAGLTVANFSVKASGTPSGAGGALRARMRTRSGSFGVVTPPPPPGEPTQITWTPRTVPAGGATQPSANGYLQTVWDAVSGTVFDYAGLPGDGSIYSSHLWFYRPGSNDYVTAGGYPGGQVCSPNLSTFPAYHHPYAEMTVDTAVSPKRLYAFGGVCSGNVPTSMYYLTLNADPTTDTWTQVQDNGFYPGSPAGQTPYGLAAVMAYDPDHDVIVWYGQASATWLFCPTASGTLSGTQTGVGCVAADKWVQLTTSGGPPTAQESPNLMWSPSVHRMILTGGSNNISTVFYHEVWSFNVATATWTQKGQGAVQPVPYMDGGSSTFSTTYDSSRDRVFYHQVGGSGYPQDWMYTPATDLWVLLSTFGTSPTQDNCQSTVMVYDVTDDLLLTRCKDSVSGSVKVYSGVIQ